MKKAFKEIAFSKSRLQTLETVNGILEEYKKDGYVLTLRQAYYQLVARNVISNNEKEYKKLSALLTDGRMSGFIDWDSIEDRVRVPKMPFYVRDIPHALDLIINVYNLHRMQGQSEYLEVWIEKDALSNIVQRITDKYHIPLMVNRGYSSCSAMKVAAERFRSKVQTHAKGATIIYLGDFDPSGLDMIRDVKERLFDFGVDVNVKQIGLTKEQIKRYSPPPNSAKITDPRAGWYIEQHGEMSWELDSLPPDVLYKLVEDEVLSKINVRKYEAILKQEQIDIQKMKDSLL